MNGRVRGFLAEVASCYAENLIPGIILFVKQTKGARRSGCWEGREGRSPSKGQGTGSGGGERGGCSGCLWMLTWASLAERRAVGKHGLPLGAALRWSMWPQEVSLQKELAGVWGSSPLVISAVWV